MKTISKKFVLLSFIITMFFGSIVHAGFYQINNKLPQMRTDNRPNAPLRVTLLPFGAIPQAIWTGRMKVAPQTKQMINSWGYKIQQIQIRLEQPDGSFIEKTIEFPWKGLGMLDITEDMGFRVNVIPAQDGFGLELYRVELKGATVIERTASAFAETLAPLFNQKFEAGELVKMPLTFHRQEGNNKIYRTPGF